MNTMPHDAEPQPQAPAQPQAQAPFQAESQAPAQPQPQAQAPFQPESQPHPQAQAQAQAPFEPRPQNAAEQAPGADPHPRTERPRPRTGPILWGTVFLVFCAYVVQRELAPATVDTAVWIAATAIGLGVLLLAVGLAVVLRGSRSR